MKGFMCPEWQRSERDGCGDKFAWAVANRPGAVNINNNDTRRRNRISAIRFSQWLKSRRKGSKLNLRYTKSPKGAPTQPGPSEKAIARQQRGK